MSSSYGHGRCSTPIPDCTPWAAVQLLPAWLRHRGRRKQLQPAPPSSFPPHASLASYVAQMSLQRHQCADVTTVIEGPGTQNSSFCWECRLLLCCVQRRALARNRRRRRWDPAYILMLHLLTKKASTIDKKKASTMNRESFYRHRSTGKSCNH